MVPDCLVSTVTFIKTYQEMIGTIEWIDPDDDRLPDLKVKLKEAEQQLAEGKEYIPLF